MGQSWSELWGDVPEAQAEASPDPHHSSSPEKGYTEQYSVIATANSVLKFDPDKSYAVCVGIDKQLDEKFNGRSLGYIAAKDAVSLGEAFIRDMGLQRDRVNIYTSNDASFLCKKAALSTLLVNYARKVEEGGIFIFHFSGHGVLIRGRNGSEWVLAPADFSGDVSTGFTANDLLELIQIADCRAHHILIILDCCYAGGIGGRMSSVQNTMRVTPGVYVMCACAAKQVSLALTVLGNSIFSFFLLHYLEKHSSKGQFAVEESMREITELCRSYSSLMMRYSAEDGLRSAMMQPRMDTIAVVEIGTPVTLDNPDGTTAADVTDSNRFGLVFSFYDRQLPKPPLHPIAIHWLSSATVQDAIETLCTKTDLPLLLQDGMICAMLYSIACLHLEHDRSHITDRNFILTAIISVVAAIGYKFPEVTINVSQLKMALKYYYKPIYSLGIPAKPIEKLWLDIYTYEESRGDQVDSDANVDNAVSDCFIRIF